MRQIRGDTSEHGLQRARVSVDRISVQRLDEWGVRPRERDLVAVTTKACQPLSRGMIGKLLAERGLADTRIAGDRHERASSVDGRGEGFQQDAQLGGAANER